ncbi:MAG: AAA family ATPase [Oscillospiraceae bacterium]|nr:AAA family ATPase [Oscillospiraceae bacterium]
MNIKTAKMHIENAMKAYFAKDEFGRYEIPIEEQRPVFLIGPPGVGKTAIMQQIADKLGVGLVSYSMNHHTRQSALGLPYITEKVYDGKTFSITEYTMSEIIASVYEMMEATGVKEGILFLDEINCVSETLAPAMLQFLQYKTFGTHKVPDGWIVVTAGNPPEYNNSVREFDIATADRLKPMEVQPDYTAWKEYACEKNVHPAILTYLEIKHEHFYSIETTVDGKRFVTARGWSDLSRMLLSCEKHGLPVDTSLIGQYLQNRKIAAEFYNYYSLWIKYRKDYKIDAILTGNVPPEILHRAAGGKFDERLALLGLIFDALLKQIHAVAKQESLREGLLVTLKEIMKCYQQPNADPIKELKAVMDIIEGKLREEAKYATRNKETELIRRQILSILQQHHAAMVADPPYSVKGAFAILKQDFDERTEAFKAQIQETISQINNAYTFCETAFGKGREIMILTTELTIAKTASQFLARYGKDSRYFTYNSDLLVHGRRSEILHQLEELDVL